MPAGAEVAVRNLKDLRGNRPGIVVVQAMDQGGKGLDVGRQPREKENRLAIRNGKIAVRSEQIRIAVAKVRQEQDEDKVGSKLSRRRAVITPLESLMASGLTIPRSRRA